MSAPKRKKAAKKGANPNLSQRLPRETGAIIAPLGDGLTVLERALLVLEGRVQETKLGFRLDGKPCNTKDILEAAGMDFADAGR